MDQNSQHASRLARQWTANWLIRLSVVLLSSPLACAQLQITPPAERLMTEAIAHSPAVAAARARLSAAEGAALQASLRPNPTVGYAGQEIGNDSAGQHGLFFQKQIVRGNKVELRHQVAVREYQARQVEFQATCQRLKLQVIRQWYVLVVSQQRAAQVRELVEMAEQTLQAIDRLVDAEEMAKTASLQSQLVVTNLRTQWMTTDLQVRAARQALSELTGLDTDGVARLATTDSANQPGQLPVIPWSSVAQRATASPKTNRLVSLTDKAAAQLSLERSKQVVDLNVQVGTYYDDSTNHVFTGVQVSRPLLWHDCNQGNIARATANLHAAHEETQLAVQSTLVSLSAAFGQYEAQRQRVLQISNDLLPTSQQALELTQTALRAGEIGYLEALVSQQSYAQTVQQYYDALDQAWRALVDLELLLLP